MANESSEDRGGPAKRSRNWDQPDGLGWEVWRRARSTALLTQPMQRDLARLRTNILRDPAPLLTDIRRRWALTGDSVVNRFSLNSPLFWAHRRVFHDGVSVEPAAVAPLSLHEPAESRVLSRTLELPLTGATELPRAMKTTGGERTREPGFVQRRLTVSEPMDVNSDVPLTEQNVSFSKPSVIGSESSFDTFDTVARRSLLPPRLIGEYARPLAMNSRTPLFASVSRRQDMRLLGSAHAMIGSFPDTDRARISARWEAVPGPAPLIAAKRDRDFGTVMRDTPGDLQAPALQRRETVGRQVPRPAPSPSATSRASAGGIGPSNTGPLAGSIVVGRKVATNSRIAVSKEPTAAPSFERTTQNAAGDAIRAGEAWSLLHAKSNSELPVARPATPEESAMRIVTEPARENVVRAEPILTKHATSEVQLAATVLSRKPEYEAMAATPLPLAHARTSLPLHTVTPRNASTVAREISLSPAEPAPVFIKAEDHGAKAADRHDPAAAAMEQAPAIALAAKTVGLSRSLDQDGPGSARTVDVSTTESSSQAARGPQPFVYGAALLQRFYGHRAARLWHEAGDPRIARRTTSPTQAHYRGEVPSLYDHRVSRLWHEAGDPRIARRIGPLMQTHFRGEAFMQRSEERAGVAPWTANSRPVSELTGPGAGMPADTISFATAASSMAQMPVMPGRARHSASDRSGDVGPNDSFLPGIGSTGFPAGAIGNETGMAQRGSIIHLASFREIPLARHAIATSRQKELVAADKPLSKLTQFLPITSASERVIRGFSQDSRVQRQQDSQGFLHSLPVASSTTIATLDYSPGSHWGFGRDLPAEAMFSAAALDGLAARPRIGNAMVHRFSPVSSVQGGSDSKARVFLKDLPLATSQRIDRSENSATAPRPVGDIAQAASQSPVGAMSGAGAAALIDGRAEPRAPQANADSVAAQMDIDELVEKAWQKIMRKLTIEQERRGYTR